METELAYPERYELAVLLSLEWYSQQSQPYLKTMVPQDLNKSTALHQGKLRVAPWFTDHQVHSLRAATLAKNLDTWGRTAKGRIAGCCHPTSIGNGSLPQDPSSPNLPICLSHCGTILTISHPHYMILAQLEHFEGFLKHIQQIQFRFLPKHASFLQVLNALIRSEMAFAFEDPSQSDTPVAGGPSGPSDCGSPYPEGGNFGVPPGGTKDVQSAMWESIKQLGVAEVNGTFAEVN